MTLRLSHRTARVVGAVGRTLIGFGVITLLFVAYQLWGTGIQQARSQDQLGDEFASRLQAIGDADRPSPPSTLPDETGEDRPPRGIGSSGPITLPGVTVTIPPEDEEPPSLDEIDPEVLAALTPVQGEPYAQIRIPSIGVDETVVYGIRVGDLRKGPGIFPSNPMPGTPGNAAIAGHRTTWGEPFHDIDLVQPGDEIVVETLQGEFTYVVEAHEDSEGNEVGHFIVPANGIHVLDDYGDDRITLVACHPKWSSRQRIIVTGLLTEPPVEPPPTTAPPVVDDDDEGPALPDEPEDWGEGLDGDRAALMPTLVWGSLFTVALLAAIVIGRWWRRWPVYLLASPVLIWLLWTSFVYLDQLMPSY